jgi:Uncharacterised nucleotidyltransferase
MTSAGDVLIRAAVHGLPHVGPVEAPLVADDPHALVAAARHQRLEGFLAAAVADGVVEVPDHDSVTDAHRQALAHCLRVEAHLLRVAEGFQAAGISFRVLKGPALAHLDYPDPSLRTFGDLDVLVPPGQLSDAVTVLRYGGHRVIHPPVSMGWARRFAKSITLQGLDGIEVDLHRSLADGRFGLTVDHDDLFAGTTPFTLAGQPLLALDPPRRLVHACYHAVLGGARGPRARRDVAQLLCVTGADLDEAIAVARRWQAEAVLAHGILDAVNLLAVDPDHPAVAWARSVDIPADQARAIDLTTVAGFDRVALTGLAAVQGPVHKVRYLAPLVLPSGTNLASRGLSRRQHLADLARRLGRRG